MYINMPSALYDYNRQSTPYVEVIRANVSNDGTFNNLNDLFEKLSIRIKEKTDREKVFDIYNDCVYFGVEESSKLNEYIKNISIKEKDNIFDYYD